MYMDYWTLIEFSLFTIFSLLFVFFLIFKLSKEHSIENKNYMIQEI